MQKGRAPACSPWLQHPLPALSAGQASSPGLIRVMSVGSPGAVTPAPRKALGVLGSASCWGCPLHPLAPSRRDSEGTRGRGEGVGTGTGCALRGAGGEEVLYLIVSDFEVLELELNEQ